MPTYIATCEVCRAIHHATSLEALEAELMQCWNARPKLVVPAPDAK